MADVAIIGMACLFPGAPDLETYWQNICAGVDAIADVPVGRLDPAFFEGPNAPPVRRGGCLDDVARFDPARHGIMPVAARGTEPDQLLALDVAVNALRDAGYEHRPFNRDRTGVFMGRGGNAGAGRMRLEAQTRGAEQTVQLLRGLIPSLTDEQLAAVRAELTAAYAPAPTPDIAIGLVPHLAAARVAHRMDLHGPAYTIDAACASALVAVDNACVELASGRCDLALAGGVHVCHDEITWTVFTQLGALSKQAQIRPFDRRADGLLIGEGVGVVVLKRRADAERDGDRIYAIVRGTGVASDGRGASLMSPSVGGQVLALERAWGEAGLDPATVELVEAHGTATAAGDAAEIETLRRVFGSLGGAATDHRAAVGSVKSMIGHTMPAAGAAGLIKTALAVYHGVLPPSLHCEEPNPALEATRFRVLGAAEPWPAGAPRRAAVNAFGFGGINAHVVLEGTGGAAVPSRARRRVLALAAESPAALLAAIPASCPESFRQAGTGPARLLVLDPTPERLARARAVVEKGRPWSGREDLWFTPRGLLTDGGRVAFLFPGVDAAFAPRIDDVCAHFGLPVPPGVDHGSGGASLEETGLGIIGVNRLMDRVLHELGVRADAIAGHSIGEWSAMIAAGVLAQEVVDTLAPAIRGGGMSVPGVLFAAAGCGREAAETVIEGLPSIALSHDNCPHQVILCGVEASLDRALAGLKARGVLCQKLPFQSGFHTPLFADHVGPHRDRFARFALAPAKTPLFSATTVDEWPAAEEAKRALAVEHFLKPVRWRELMLALHERGVRLFIQAGTGSLVGFVEDTLRGRPHLAVSANDPKRGGLEQLLRVAAAVWTEGGAPRFERLLDRPAAGEKLPLGVPLWKPRTPLPVGATTRPTAKGPLAAAFADGLDAIEKAGAEVLAAAAPKERHTTRVLSLQTMPELVDHEFFRQPPGWKNVVDRHPVVPMTAMVALMMDAARELCPGQVAVGLEDARAFRWLAVGTPVTARFSARLVAPGRVVVAIDGYAEATVLLAAAYPPAPRYVAPPPPAGARPCGVSARELYAQRLMFHGPAYQGITEMDTAGDDGMSGVLRAGRACGALIDAAGQLLGFWVTWKNDVNRMAMPVHIARMSFYGPDPAPGARVACDVRVKRQDEREAVADLVLATGDRVWARIDGWMARRFETDERLWTMFVWPEHNLLAVPDGDGVVYHDRFRAVASRDQLARRFLTEKERAEHDAQPPRGQRAWLAARIAAKDAVRHFLWRRGAADEPIWPVEIELGADSRRARFRGGLELAVDVVVDGDIARGSVVVP